MLDFKNDQPKESNRVAFSEINVRLQTVVLQAQPKSEVSNCALPHHTGPRNFGYCIIRHKRKFINYFVQIEFHLHVRSME